MKTTLTILTVVLAFAVLWNVGPFLKTNAMAADATPAAKAEEPPAWIHFARTDKDVCIYNGFPFYFVGDNGLDLAFNVDPDPKHSLAIMFLCKMGSGTHRSIKINVNGKEKIITNLAIGNGKQTYFWETIPVTDFGITRAEKGPYRINLRGNKEGGVHAVIPGLRLITDPKQLDTLPLPTATKNAEFLKPGHLSEAELIASKVDRNAA